MNEKIRCLGFASKYSMRWGNKGDEIRLVRIVDGGNGFMGGSVYHSLCFCMVETFYNKEVPKLSGPLSPTTV